MNTKTDQGGRRAWVSKHLVILIVVILTILFALACLSQSERSDAEELTTTNILDTSSIHVDVNTDGLNEYLNQQMDNNVNPSTIPLNDLKTFFTVIATDNEGQNLSSENGGIQFYLFLGEPLLGVQPRRS